MRRVRVGLPVVIVLLSLSPAFAAIDREIPYDESRVPLLQAQIFALAVGPDGAVYSGGGGSTLPPPWELYLRRHRNGFDEDFSYSPGADNQVFALAIDPRGNLLVGGLIANLGGLARSRLGRVLPSGAGDPTFADPAFDGSVRALAVEPNGQILVGGTFTTAVGQPRLGLVRLSPSGALDLAFPAVSGGAATVHVIAVQRDGGILVGGDFTHVGGQPRANLARLLPSGAVDATFTAGTDGRVTALLELHDRRILVGGVFATLAGSPRASLGRLAASGALDATFDPGTDGDVRAFLEQGDGRILVGGRFDVLGGAPAHNLGRLFRDGLRDPPAGTVDFTSTFHFEGPPDDGTDVSALAQTLDGRIVAAMGVSPFGETFKWVGVFYANGYKLWRARVFDPSVTAGDTDTVAQAPNGDVLWGGSFENICGTTAHVFARMSEDMWDFPASHLLPAPAVGPFGNFPVRAIAVDRAGRAVLCGAFTEVGGQGRNGLARIDADGALDLAFVPPAGPGECAGLDIDESDPILAVYRGATGGVRRYLSSGAPDPAFVVATTPVLHTFSEVAALPGGKILAAGGHLNIDVPSRIVRLKADGAPDATFSEPVLTWPGQPALQPFLGAIAVRRDGAILISGRFDSVAGVARSGVARLLEDGALDTAFDPPPEIVYEVVGGGFPRAGILFVEDGRAYVSGRFDSPAVGVRDPIVKRLLASGAEDPEFVTPWRDGPRAFAVDVQPSGGVLFGSNTGLSQVWWDEAELDSFGQALIARLRPTQFPRRKLVATSPSVHWSIDGTTPEFRAVWFELSTDGGTIWSNLGAASRVPDGFRLTGLALPLQQSLLVRARGEYRTSSGVSQWSETRAFWLADSTGEIIFADGFESGETWLWSLTVP